jgi:hypothetical protein
MDLTRSPVRFCLPSCAAAFLVSVVACQDNNPPSSVPPDSSTGDAADSSVSTFPDTSMPEEVGPADAPTDAPLCNGHLPAADLRDGAYVPPLFHPMAIPGACTDAEISAYTTACVQDETAAPCNAWKADPKNATCEACVWRNDGTGPLRFYPDGSYAAINESGCMALAGAPSCGAELDSAWYCLVDACGTCPADGGQFTGTCYENVYMGDCLNSENAGNACESTVTGLPVNCEVCQPDAQRLPLTLTLFCGTPSEAGPPNDSGASDASDAAATDGAQE